MNSRSIRNIMYIFSLIWLALAANTTVASIGGIGSGTTPQSAEVVTSQSLQPIVTEYGKISLSLDALGMTGNSGFINIHKPVNATVRKAYLAAATTGFLNVRLNDGDIKIEGQDVLWESEIPSSIFAYNYWAEVTSIIKPIVDTAEQSLIALQVYEDYASGIDGEILAVIFDDPNQNSENTITLFFGAQNVNGDSFAITLSEPVELSTTGLRMDLSLGISYGCQGDNYCGGGPSAQYSQINVNGKRLTTAAGGHDDGELQNGALITVGGIGDTTGNPSDPGALPTNPRSDDELYDLIPFVSEGDKTIRIDTLNPSVDDNIFFAGLFLAGSQASVVYPFLELPFNYSYTNFAVAALGSNNGSGPGRVNSWFDHQLPRYYTDGYIKGWQGTAIKDPANVQCIFGYNCYDGHNGIDFRIRFRDTSEPVLAAAPGVVIDLNRNWPTTCGNKGCDYGNYVLIQHTNNRYATLYAHLYPVTSNIFLGKPMTDREVLGGIGSTGRSTGPHIHFGVYFDDNGDGYFSEDEVVDPYGWDNWREQDPWEVSSVYLWKYPIISQSLAGFSPAIIASQSGHTMVNIPPESLSSNVNLELIDAPPVAQPSAQLRSTGNSFWLRVLEWLNQSMSHSLSVNQNQFTIPVTISVDYEGFYSDHLNQTQLRLTRWDEVNQQWIDLETNLDTSQSIATAQTTEVGWFDLQAPLLCPADEFEINDNLDASREIRADGNPLELLFDLEQDEDWFRFEGIKGGEYIIRTDNLGGGVDTVIELYDQDGLTLLASDDNSGDTGASFLEWIPDETATFFIRVTRTELSTFGCSASYALIITQSFKLSIPIVRR